VAVAVWVTVGGLVIVGGAAGELAAMLRMRALEASLSALSAAVDAPPPPPPDAIHFVIWGAPSRP
jgi:hypothetical protein